METNSRRVFWARSGLSIFRVLVIRVPLVN
jgi:hypothetical protein